MEAVGMSNAKSILLLCVGPRRTPGLQEALFEQGLRVWTCESNSRSDSLLDLRCWSLVLIDLVHVLGGGLAACARVRENFAGPVVVVSARGDERKQLKVLETGADEFIDWPINSALFGARIRAAMRWWTEGRRSTAAIEAPFRAGGLEIDPARREVRRDGLPVELTDLEFDLLHLLARHAGTPVSRDTLYNELRGLPFNGQDRSMDLRISRLRRKLSGVGLPYQAILTVRGRGYQLAAAPL